MRVKTVLKMVVSALLLLLVLSVVDLPRLKETLLSLSPWTVVLVVLMYLCGQLLSSLKWWIIVRAGGIAVSFPTALKAYFIGMFVNVLGVGTLGGDMTRAVFVAPAGAPRAPAFASVIADRAHGMAVLAGIGSIAAALFGTASLPLPLVLLLASLGLSVVVGWIIGPRLVRIVVPSSHPFRNKCDEILAAFPQTPRVVALITALSAAFHLLQISIHAVMAAGLSASIPWTFLLVAVPFANIVSTLPISWQGLGVRENAYRFFFVPAVLSHEQALAFGAIWLFASTFSGCLGGLVALLTGDFDALTRRVSAPEPGTSPIVFEVASKRSSAG